MKNNLQKSSLFLTLLTSGSTLICCVIPAIFVLLGAGSAVAAFVGIFPQVVWLSEHKSWLFGMGSILLGVSYYLSFMSRLSCPIDPMLAQACGRAKRWTKIIWWTSFVLYLIGFIVSYILPSLVLT